VLIDCCNKRPHPSQRPSNHRRDAITQSPPRQHAEQLASTYSLAAAGDWFEVAAPTTFGAVARVHVHPLLSVSKHLKNGGSATANAQP
jgi:hypothetical protein